MDDKRQWRILVDAANRLRERRDMMREYAILARANGHRHSAADYQAAADAYHDAWNILGMMVRGEL